MLLTFPDIKTQICRYDLLWISKTGDNGDSNTTMKNLLCTQTPKGSSNYRIINNLINIQTRNRSFLFCIWSEKAIALSDVARTSCI